MRTSWLIAVAALPAWPLAAAVADEAAAPPPVVIKRLLATGTTSSGQPIVLPQQDAELDVSTYDIAPGAVLPEHEHPFPRYAYVLAGTLSVSNDDTGRTETYEAGEVVVEAVGQWHRGAAVGAEPVRLLVIDLVERGRDNTVLRR